MRLQAYVFCDCYEQGRLRRPLPNPELVKILPNGDLTSRSKATQEQHDAFVAWRTHGCRHPAGSVTGGELGHRLPINVLRDALFPARRSFPIFFRKVLECKPRTSTSHLTLKQVEKLEKELPRLRSYHCADPKTDLERRYFCGQMKQLVRAALKFRKPIAM